MAKQRRKKTSRAASTKVVRTLTVEITAEDCELIILALHAVNATDVAIKLEKQWEITVDTDQRQRLQIIAAQQLINSFEV